MAYCYSRDEELFYGEFDTIEGALAEAFGELDSESLTSDVAVYIGEVDKKTAAGYLTQHHIEDLLDNISTEAAEDCGEVADDWFSFPVPARVMRSGELKTAFHARDWSEEKIQQSQSRWEDHNKSMAELTEKIRTLIDEWATNTDNQPNFWGVKNVKRYFKNGNCEIP